MSIDAPRRFRGAFRQDAEARAVYSETAGIQRIIPLAVAVPVDVDDLQLLVAWARSEGAALIPRGSGTSMSGAAVGPGVIVDLSRWKSIGKVNVDQRTVTVGPGAICGEVDRVARQAGLRFPVNPSSSAFCTIGGMTATNASGAHTLGFGSMREWVTGLGCVFADSRHVITRSDARNVIMRPGRNVIPSVARDPLLLALPPASPEFSAAIHPGVRKDSSGYATARYSESHDLIDLLVGSEGTLAFFTQIELKLTPLPGATASVMGVFRSLASATDAAIRARAAGAVACELLDRTFLDFIATNAATSFDPSTEAILLAEVEGESSAAAADAVSAVAKEFTKAGAAETRIARSAEEAETLWSLRHAASPTLARMSDRFRSMQFIEDGAVPPERLGEYVAGVRAALDRHKIRGVIFGHAGDAHAHVNPMIDPKSPGWRAAVDGLMDEVTGLCASFGGTISGEHGDGRIRTPELSRVWSQASLDGFARVKQAFDPTGLLNPGVKVGAATAPYPIKYDPDLPPHPERAARILADVERTRTYSDFRLDRIESA